MGLVSHHSSGRASYHYFRALRNISKNIKKLLTDNKIYVIIIGHLTGEYYE